jgi:CHAT domain-containing protein
MWPVYDASTMMLMSRYYSLWLAADGTREAMPAHTALRLAQIWVRDTTNREKAEFFRAQIPELREDSGRMAAEAARAGFAWARMHDPDERSHADPYHWAAFHYTGAVTSCRGRERKRDSGTIG